MLSLFFGGRLAASSAGSAWFEISAIVDISPFSMDALCAEPICLSIALRRSDISVKRAFARSSLRSSSPVMAVTSSLFDTTSFLSLNEKLKMELVDAEASSAAGLPSSGFLDSLGNITIDARRRKRPRRSALANQF